MKAKPPWVWPAERVDREELLRRYPKPNPMLGYGIHCPLHGITIGTPDPWCPLCPTSAKHGDE